MIRSYGISKTGLVRKVNEDCILLGEKPFFILADGMGGYEGGQVASRLAVKAAGDFLSALAPEDYSEDAVREAFLRANRAVLSKKLCDESLSQMGTTLVIAALSEKGLYWGHVGDSRLYLFRGGKLTQITTDHSVVMRLVEEGKITKEEMRAHPRKNEITRAVGVGSVLAVDTGFVPPDGPSVVMLCSDGVSTMLGDGELADILAAAADPRTAAETLMERVYEAGASDNTSAILVFVKPDGLEEGAPR